MLSDGRPRPSLNGVGRPFHDKPSEPTPTLPGRCRRTVDPQMFFLACGASGILGLSFSPAQSFFASQVSRRVVRVDARKRSIWTPSRC